MGKEDSFTRGTNLTGIFIFRLSNVKRQSKNRERTNKIQFAPFWRTGLSLLQHEINYSEA